jgi:hypothetical protein
MTYMVDRSESLHPADREAPLSILGEPSHIEIEPALRIGLMSRADAVVYTRQTVLELGDLTH